MFLIIINQTLSLSDEHGENILRRITKADIFHKAKDHIPAIRSTIRKKKPGGMVTN